MINLIPFKQFISAGHHDNDPGAVANGYQENELTKDLRNRILKYGNSKEIIVDRDSETNREYQNRIKPGAGSVVLDIHFDAGPSRVTGVTAFVNEKDFQNKDSLSAGSHSFHRMPAASSAVHNYLQMDPEAQSLSKSAFDRLSLQLPVKSAVHSPLTAAELEWPKKAGNSWSWT